MRLGRKRRTTGEPRHPALRARDCPPSVCPICGMHDPDGLTRWGGRLAHQTCVEWLDDPLMTPLPCYDHDYGPWAPIPSDGRPTRRRDCTKCGGYQTVYTDPVPARGEVAQETLPGV